MELHNHNILKTGLGDTDIKSRTSQYNTKHVDKVK